MGSHIMFGVAEYQAPGTMICCSIQLMYMYWLETWLERIVTCLLVFWMRSWWYKHFMELIDVTLKRHLTF